MAYTNPNMEALREDTLSSTLTQGFGGTYPGEPPTDFGGQHFPVFHRGVDYVLPGGEGGTVRSPATGIVIDVGNDSYDFSGGLGNNKTIIQSASGTRYIFGHLHDRYMLEDRYGHPQTGGPVTQRGTRVLAGDIIGHQGGGQSGEGYASGPHLHLELHNDAWKSPENPVGLGNLTTNIHGNPTDDLYYRLAHPLGFGAGDFPGQSPFPGPPPQDWRSQMDTPFPIPGLSGQDPPGNPTPIPGSGSGGGPNPAPVPPTVPACQPGQTALPAPDPGGNWSNYVCMSNTDIASANCSGGMVPVSNPLLFPPVICKNPADLHYQAPGGPFGGIGNIVGNIGNYIGVAALSILGVAVIVVGLVSITKEKPVQQVLQPATQTVGVIKGAGETVGKAAATVAKVAA